MRSLRQRSSCRSDSIRASAANRLFLAHSRLHLRGDRTLRARFAYAIKTESGTEKIDYSPFVVDAIGSHHHGTLRASRPIGGNLGMRMPRIIHTVVAGVSIAAALWAVPAFAEGGFNSSLSGVHPGFESRTWTDKNLDGTNGYVNIYGCTPAPPAGGWASGDQIGVFREHFGPDEFIKRGDTCNAAVYFGDTASGNYHFTVERIEGSGDSSKTLSATNVVVRY